MSATSPVLLALRPTTDSPALWRNFAFVTLFVPIVGSGNVPLRSPAIAAVSISVSDFAVSPIRTRSPAAMFRALVLSRARTIVSKPVPPFAAVICTISLLLSSGSVKSGDTIAMTGSDSAATFVAHAVLTVIDVPLATGEGGVTTVVLSRFG